MTTRSIVRVTDDTTRADLAETLAIINDEAKMLRRRGFVGIHSAAYALKHAQIDALLTDWQAAT